MSFLDADFSAIEARICPWLAGQEDALDQYRAQDAATTEDEKKRLDRYRIMAAEIYQIPVDQVNKHPQRFIGKQAILLSGFQGGPTAFRKGCAKFGYKDMPAGLEDIAVGTFRKKHQHIVRYWYAVDNAARHAITHPGEVFRAIPKHRKGESYSTPLPKFQDVRFVVKNIEGTPFLLIRLPSGRKLSYPRPCIRPSRKFEGSTSIFFFGQIPKSSRWGFIDTYGGSLVENITQAVAADLMANGAHNAERAGYHIATLIHDQGLAYHYAGQTAEEFVRLLTTLPPWAAGLPLAAEGSIVPFYRKE